MAKLYCKYWGKAEKITNDKPAQYHLLPFHCLDVAAVGWHLLEPKKNRCQRLATQLEVEPEWLRTFFIFCLVLHDLGKFARAFQGLRTDLPSTLVKADPRMSYTERHDSLGFCLWRERLVSQVGARLKDTVEWLPEILSWLEIVFGHHGMPPKKSGIKIGNFFNNKDEEAACEFVCDAITFFLSDFDPTPLLDSKRKNALKTVSWQLAGITVLADWQGSNSDFFEYYSRPMTFSEYWQTKAVKYARKATEAMPVTPSVSQFRSIKKLFSFINSATPLQKYAINEPLEKTPQLFILEDVTGAGKTEAALVLTHRLFSAGLADGLYVALPTMATANAMYQRLGKVYRRFYQTEQPSLVLAHGARQLSEEFRKSVAYSGKVVLAESTATDSNYSNDRLPDNQDLTATAFCQAWLADSRKKALLADVGVGTIDQALLAVLPARHQSLRLLGLNRKVLLVDEVHAYDPYMFKLLEALLEIHARQGGSAILLSATLPQAMRTTLTAAFQAGLDSEPPEPCSNAYPLATHIPTSGNHEQYIDTREDVKRTVEVRRLDNDGSIHEQIEQAVRQGKCVCWIRNTVKEARRSFQELIDAGWLEEKKLHLFHSRFAMLDRQRIEADTLDRFGENSNYDQRKGQVLVATQVVEQSLDLDFDVMFTDLAPIDLIIQRAGRLCRHVRGAQGNRMKEPGAMDQRGKPVLFILAPKVGPDVDENWLKVQQPGTQAVYPHVGQLWLTTNLLFGSSSHGEFTMPKDARELIEGVYSPQVEEDIPEILLEASWDAVGKAMMQQSMARLNVLKLSKGYTRRSGEWDEESRIPTRLTESETISVALALYCDGQLSPYAGNVYLPWAMSTVKIPEREWKKAKAEIPPRFEPLIEELKNEVKGVRWLEVFPLCDDTDHYYNADHGWQP